MDGLTSSPTGVHEPAPENEAPTKKRRTASAVTGKAVTKKGRGTSSKPRKPTSMKQVNQLLHSLGVVNLHEVSCCLKAGIFNGYVRLSPEQSEYGLDQTLVSDECPVCGEEQTCTVRNALYQSDFGGNDYETGGETASYKCNSDECSGMGLYITGICHGDPCFETGKFHNHCRDCPKFGVCLGDYRETHGHKKWVWVKDSV